MLSSQELSLCVKSVRLWQQHTVLVEYSYWISETLCKCVQIEKDLLKLGDVFFFTRFKKKKKKFSIHVQSSMQIQKKKWRSLDKVRRFSAYVWLDRYNMFL